MTMPGQLKLANESTTAMIRHTKLSPSITRSVCKLLVATFLFATFSFAVAAFPQAAEAQEKRVDDPKAVKLYGTASNMFNEGEFETAIPQFEKVLSDYPEFSYRRDAQYFSGMAHLRLKQYDKAINRFGSLRDSLPNFKDYKRSDSLLFSLGYCQLQAGIVGKEQGTEDLLSATKTFQQLFDNFDSPKDGADAWFLNGEAYYHLNEIAGSQHPIEKAAENYKVVIDRFAGSPVRPKALFLYGLCLKQAGQYASALKIFESFLNEYNDHEMQGEVLLNKAKAVQQIGVAHKKAGDAEQADKYLADAESIFAELTRSDSPLAGSELQPVALLDRANGLLYLLKYSQAATLYGTIANDFPTFERAEDCAMDAGKYYYFGKDLTQAEKWLAAVIKQDNKFRAEATHWLAKTKLDNGEFEQALQLANGAMKDAGEFEANLKFDAAQALERSPKRKQESVEAYMAIVQDFPEHNLAPKALYFASFGFLELNETDKAIETAQRFIKQHKTHADLPWVKDVLGRAALRDQQLPLAKKTFTDLVNNNANMDRADWWQTRLGWISYMEGDTDTAIATMSQAVGKMNDPLSRAEAWHIIGSSQFDLKNYVKTIEALEKSVVENPKARNRAEITLLTARSYASRSNVGKAIELVQPIWQQAKDPIAAYWLGEFEYQREKFGDAETYYQAVVDDGKSPAMPDALFGLAWSKSKQGNSTGAQKLFDRLVADYPESSVANDALVGRGQSLRLAGNSEEAIKDLNKFLANTKDPVATFRSTLERAMCYRDLEQWDDAIQDFEALEKTIDQDPSKEVEVIFELAWAHRSKGNQPKSLQYFQRLADDFQGTQQAAEAHYAIGQAHYEKEDLDTAIVHYQVALKDSKDPNIQERAAYKLGYSFFGKEEYPKALQAFKTQTDSFPEGDLHAYGLAMVAETHYWLKQHADAVTVFKKSIPAMNTDAGSKINRILALIHAAESANRTKEYELASQFAQTVVDDYPDSEFKGDALNEVAAAQKGLGNRDKAVEAWTKAAESFGKAGAKAYCMLGEELFADKEFSKAIEQFKLVLFAPESEKTPASVKKWKAFAAYECARCYYVQVSSSEDPATRKALLDNAKKWFDHLVTNYPNDRLAPDAKKQLARINGG